MHAIYILIHLFYFFGNSSINHCATFESEATLSLCMYEYVCNLMSNTSAVFKLDTEHDTFTVPRQSDKARDF